MAFLPLQKIKSRLIVIFDSKMDFFNAMQPIIPYFSLKNSKILLTVTKKL